MGRINKNLKKGKNVLFVLTMFYIKPQLLSLGTHTVADMNRKSISLFALSDNDSKLPLDVLVSVLTHLSHNGRTRDIRETPGAIVSQLTTVKARPLYVINIHADVVQRCTLCGTLYTVCNDFLYHEHEI